MAQEQKTKTQGPDEDLGLVERALAGEASAFESLVRRHERRAYRTTLAVTGNAEDAEEAMQDAFIKAYQHLSDFRRESRFSTWLTRIAVNEALQVRRRTKPMESLDDPEAAEPMMPQRLEKWHDNPEKVCGRREIRDFVEEAIQSLPPIYREAFVLRDLEELTTAEAAQALGLNITALKSRLLRARLMMREILAEKLQRPPTLKSRVARAGVRIRSALAAGFRRSGGRSEEK